MKLTELKEKIDAALKLHDDYDVRIIVNSFEENHIINIDEVDIDSGRFNFNIYSNITNLIGRYYT